MMPPQLATVGLRSTRTSEELPRACTTAPAIPTVRCRCICGQSMRSRRWACQLRTGKCGAKGGLKGALMAGGGGRLGCDGVAYHTDVFVMGGRGNLEEEGLGQSLRDQIFFFAKDRP